jgi:hypothetical protein
MITEAGLVAVIELRVDKVAQLFDTLDPLPFRERDLDREAEDFIVGWARELPHTMHLCLRIHLPAQEAAGEEAGHIEPALRRYFTHRAEAAKKEIKELFRLGRIFLAIGITVLAVCVALGGLLTRLIPNPDLARLISEGLIILGWVANWRPLEIFLYDWWPILRRKSLFQRLAAASITLAPR